MNVNKNIQTHDSDLSVHKNSKSGVMVVVLAGSRDFGRCPIASRLPVSLWPVLQRPVVERVLKAVNAQGFQKSCICFEGDIGPFKKLKSDAKNLQVSFYEELLRVGTAGCLRDAAGKNFNGLFVMIPASIIYTPDINLLVDFHLEQKADLTAVVNPGYEKSSQGGSAGIYICDKTVLENIPQYGYCDIKEWLIPEMLRKGKSVKTLQLPRDVGNFRDGLGYLRALTNYLETGPVFDDEVSSLRQRGEYWVDENTDVDPSARIIGPVVVMANAQIAAGAVVFGPTVIGRNCRLGRDSIVANSVLWDDAAVNEKSEVQNCLLDFCVEITGNTIVQNKVVPYEKTSVIAYRDAQELNLAGSRPAEAEPLLVKEPTTKTPAAGGSASWVAWLTGILIAVAFLWAYWPGIADLWNIWLQSDEYSSGILVPFLAGYVLWSRRDILKTVPIKPALWGLIALLLAEALRLFGLFFMYGSAERLSVVAAFIALVLILLGWRFVKKTASVMLFLFLMLPWPNRMQAAVALPLQRWATSSAVFCLETIGYDVFYEGNVIHIGNTTVAVVEACNGLRMITAFFVISGLVALLVKRQWWEKLIILLSSLPVALLCNTVRLAITAVAFTWLNGDYWEKIFHDFGGYAMMPLALAIVILEMWLIDRLTVQNVKTEPIIITGK